MNNHELVTAINNKATTTSLKVAEAFGKKHNHVLRDIQTIINTLGATGGGVSSFGQTSYTHPQNGQTYPMFTMDKEAFQLLVMGFTGKEALVWKQRFIEAFSAMEAELNRKHDLFDPSKLSRKDILMMCLEAEEELDELEPRHLQQH